MDMTSESKNKLKKDIQHDYTCNNSVCYYCISGYIKGKNSRINNDPDLFVNLILQKNIYLPLRQQKKNPRPSVVHN